MIIERTQSIGLHAPIEIGGKVVEYKQVSKVLVVYIDNRFDWYSNIEKNLQKAFRNDSYVKEVPVSTVQTTERKLLE